MYPKNCYFWKKSSSHFGWGPQDSVASSISLINDDYTYANMQYVKECKNTFFKWQRYSHNSMYGAKCYWKVDVWKSMWQWWAAAHFMHADRCISVLLLVFYNRVITRWHLYENNYNTFDMIKNKSGGMSSVNNYLRQLSQLLQNILKLFCWNVDTKSGYYWQLVWI